MNQAEILRAEREQMVTSQIEHRGVHDPLVLAAMRKVPRHCFIPDSLRSQAYADIPLPIGSNQTISQPYIVALMTSLLELHGEENVLEIGTGSGYQAAVLSCLVKTVHTVERYAELAEGSDRVLKELGYHNVNVYVGDGSGGWPEHAPYDAIIVTAAAPDVPDLLLPQLIDGGRLVIPIGPRYSQELQLWRRSGGNYTSQDVLPVAFVPLRGKYGWQETGWT